MPEEERLEIVSAVEDEFSGALERFESALDDVDDEIRQTGDGEDSIIVDVEVRGVESAITELEELNAALESIDDDIDITTDRDVSPDRGGGSGRTGEAVTSGGRIIRPSTRDLVTSDEPNLSQAQRLRRRISGPKEAIQAARARTISRRLRMFSSRAKRLRLTVRGIHLAFAALLPLVITLVGALPVVIVGVAALGAAALTAAGALAAIGGLGLVGMSLQETGEVSMQPIRERLSKVGDAFVDAFAPLAQSFVPVVEEAITTIEAMAGPLATASGALLELRGAFQGVFDFIAQTLPSFVRDAVAFADVMMPLLSGAVQELANFDFFGFLAHNLQRALPQLRSMFNSLKGILGAVLQLSHGFAVLAQFILKTASVITAPLRMFPVLGKTVGGLIATFFTLSAIVGITRILFSGATLEALKMAQAIATKLVPSLQANINTLQASTTWTLAWAKALGLVALKVAAITAGLSLLTAGLSKAMTEFDVGGVGDSEIQNQLQAFANRPGSLRGPGFSQSSSAAGNANVYQDNSTVVINADNRDDAARQQYASDFERRQHIDSVFGGGA